MQLNNLETVKDAKINIVIILGTFHIKIDPDEHSRKPSSSTKELTPAVNVMLIINHLEPNSCQDNYNNNNNNNKKKKSIFSSLCKTHEFINICNRMQQPDKHLDMQGYGMHSTHLLNLICKTLWKHKLTAITGILSHHVSV